MGSKKSPYLKKYVLLLCCAQSADTASNTIGVFAPWALFT
jgi:hypothetical protein